jgi:hypothetical protein
MILGLDTATFTLVHVILSFIGIGTGFIVIFGMIAAKRLPFWTTIFLVTTVLTSLTGFLFPNKSITPGIILGILSMIVLIPAIIARYGGHLAGGWRGTYVSTAILAQYFNFFVLIAQSFDKVPALHALGHTPADPAFKIAQAVALVLFIVLGTLAYKKFRIAV